MSQTAVLPWQSRRRGNNACLDISYPVHYNKTAQFHMHGSARNGLTGNLQNKAAPATVLEDEVFEP